MAKIIYKLGPQCSGKTAWLCQQAKREAGKEIVYYTSPERVRHANSFAEKYEYMYTGVCSFDVVTNPDDIALDTRVILIDEFMRIPDASQVVHKFENNDNVTIYVVLTQEDYDTENIETPSKQDWDQLSLF